MKNVTPSRTAPMGVERKMNQCPLMYRIQLNKSCQAFKQVAKSSESPFPMEFLMEFPGYARINAIIYIESNVDEERFKPSDFDIYFIDMNTGVEYLIYDGKKLTPEILSNLEQECLLYERYGYGSYKGWIMKDEEGKSYHILDNPYTILDYYLESASD